MKVELQAGIAVAGLRLEPRLHERRLIAAVQHLDRISRSRLTAVWTEIAGAIGSPMLGHAKIGPWIGWIDPDVGYDSLLRRTVLYGGWWRRINCDSSSSATSSEPVSSCSIRAIASTSPSILRVYPSGCE